MNKQIIHLIIICMLGCPITNGHSQTSDVKDLAIAVTGGNRFFSQDLKPLILGIGVISGVKKRIDCYTSIQFSSLKYSYKDEAASSDDNMLTDFTIAARWKLFSDLKLLVPFLSSGVSVSHYDTHIFTQFPFGAGMQFKLKPGYFFYLETIVDIPTGSLARMGFNTRIGISGNISKRKAKIRLPLEDDDIRMNFLHKDSDGDGVLDSMDSCIYVPGSSRFHGCPIPDSDGDGIDDELDECPNEAGNTKYRGCKTPDSDGDGIDDDADRCPIEKGNLQEGGCPIDTASLNKRIAYACTGILFESASSVLKAESFAVLDSIVFILLKYPRIIVYVEGHTDNVGKEKLNLALSQARAMAVTNYLIRKGVAGSIIIAKGYGYSQPVAENSTVEGRTKNRRVYIYVGGSAAAGQKEK